MTLPSRRKHPIIAPSTLASKRARAAVARCALSAIDLTIVCWRKAPIGKRDLFAALALVASTSLGIAQAQQPWQPNRLPPSGQAQRLAGATSNTPIASDSTARRSVTNDLRQTGVPQANGSAEQLGPNTVLRWRTSGPGNNSSAQNGSNGAQGGNPLRQASVASSAPRGGDVRQVQYQLSNSPSLPQDQLSETVETTRQWLDRLRANARPNDDRHPAGYPVQDRQPSSFPDITDDTLTPLLDEPQLDVPKADPLDLPESAPEPPAADEYAPTVEEPTIDPPSFPPQFGEDDSPADLPSPKERDLVQPLDSFRPPARAQEEVESEADDFGALLERAGQATPPNCDVQREELRGQPIANINLDVSPKLSDGLRSATDKSGDNEQEKRTELAGKALKRQWTDYRGTPVADGRLVDLRFGNAIVDVDGFEKKIPIGDLSDVDVTYIAELWNLPFRCGTGFEPLDGRQFIASTVQWKASGGCHNPLYFEQIQLERYGHETGPLLQPLLSSAHFFATIPMLPYKMAINPPKECQYTLGYYRPGNCAPYMVQPFPWSVKAGLVEAGFWTGTAALFP